MFSKRRTLTVASIMVLLLAACGPGAASTPAATAAPRATAASTATPQPGATPASTVTAKPTPTAAPAAQATPKSGGTLVMWNRQDPRNYDGHSIKSGGYDTRIMHNLVFSLLLTYPSTKETQCLLSIRPEAAESYQWVSDTILEIKLRKGIKFQNRPPVNGREVTAQDVVYSMDRGIKQDRIRGSEGMAPYLKKIEALDRYTVRFETDRPLPSLLSDGLASMYGAVILPSEVVEPYGGWNDPRKSYIGSGPYTFSEHVPGVKVVFDKHKDYFKPGLPYADRIVQLIVPDPSTMLATVASGKMDIAQDRVDLPLARATARMPQKPQVQRCPHTSPRNRLAMRTDLAPFNDVRVRRAISMAIDREGLIKSVLEGEGEIGAPFGPIHPWFISPKDLPAETRKYLEYNPQEAKRLLAEAGYPTGFNVTIATNSLYGTIYLGFVQGVADELSKVGIKAKIEMQESVAFGRTTAVGDYPSMAVTSDSISEVYLAFSGLTPAADFNLNKNHIADPELRKLYEQLAVAVDDKKARDIAYKLQVKVVDEAMDLRLPSYYDYSIIQPWVKGYYMNVARYTSTWAEALWLDR